MSARRILVTTLAAAVIAGGGVNFATSAAAASGDTVVVNCAGKCDVKPKSITIACGDASALISKITWSKWDANSATGTGKLVWNTCLPKTCMAGIVRKYPVRIELGGLASGPNVNVFSKVQLSFPKTGPAGLETGSYTIDNPRS